MLWPLLKPDLRGSSRLKEIIGFEIHAVTGRSRILEKSVEEKWDDSLMRQVEIRRSRKLLGKFMALNGLMV